MTQLQIPNAFPEADKHSFEDVDEITSKKSEDYSNDKKLLWFLPNQLNELGKNYDDIIKVLNVFRRTLHRLYPLIKNNYFDSLNEGFLIQTLLKFLQFNKQKLQKKNESETDWVSYSPSNQVYCIFVNIVKKSQDLINKFLLSLYSFNFI